MNEKDGGEKRFEWDPEWDFLDAEEIERQIEGLVDEDHGGDAPGDRGPSGEAVEKWRKFMSAIDDLASDKEVMPLESREFLAPIMRNALKEAARKEKAFSEGNIVLNFRQYKRFCESAAFLKDLKSRGLVESFTPHFLKSSSPSEIEFTFGELRLNGEDRIKLAAMIEGVCRFQLFRKDGGPITARVAFPKMWLRVDPST